jgi:ribosomal protein S18 acetylase RimI-like enzyme
VSDISRVTNADLADLLPLLRGYCDFYEVTPSDEALIALCEALIADPDREGIQLIARDEGGAAVGFATVYWCWGTLDAARIGIMNDLYVAPSARGSGLADDLINACLEESRQHGAEHLTWQTAKDNLRAQRVYDRIGATRAEWVDYSLPVSS